MTMGLEFGEQTFLRTASFVKDDSGASIQIFVGDHHFEFIAKFMGHKEVQLNRAFPLPLAPSADEQEAETLISRVRLPVALEVGDLAVEPAPSLTSLDHLLQLREPLERNAD